MKKLLSLSTILLACALNAAPNEQAETRSKIFLPPPPTSDSAQFIYDQAKYTQGLVLRRTDRGEVAAKDANFDIFHSRFDEALRLKVDKKSTPAIYALIDFIAQNIGCGEVKKSKGYAAGLKKRYNRARPYVLFSDSTCVKKDEEKARNNSSYPSRHSICGWAAAVALASIAPQRADLLIQRGYEFGQSRVICGYHWQSDVDAGRMVADQIMAEFVQKDEFIKLLKAAKDEYDAKSSK